MLVVSGVAATATAGQPVTYTGNSLGCRFNKLSSQVATRIESSMLFAKNYWTSDTWKTKIETNGTHEYEWLVVIYKLDIVADLINPPPTRHLNLRTEGDSRENPAQAYSP